jgi:hypothetical protein
MNVLKFMQKFPTEESCKLHFKEQREKNGIKCKKCGSKKHYWLKAKWQWQCADCSFRSTLRSGTIMQSSKLPVQIWYLAILFMSATKKGMSACELQRQLDYKRYDTIWSLMHRIRSAMGNRDERYQLEGMIELDEGYFEKATPDGIKLKRGKGSAKQQNVVVMAESTFLEDIETGEKSKHCRYFKMKVVENHKKDGINKLVKESLDEKTIIFSDQSNSYLDIADYVEAHFMEKSTKEVTKTTLKWVHIAISNAKRTFLGIYHKMKGKYLQLYLDEFCYKLNRRYFGNRLFDRLTIAVADNITGT